MVSKGLDKRVTYRRKIGYRTASNKFKIVRTPGNGRTIQYLKKTYNAPRNPHYLGGKTLSGLPALTPAQRKRAGAADRTIDRAYGGVLSHDLVRQRIIRAFLVEEQKIVKRVLKIKKETASKETAKPTQKAAAKKKK